LVIGCFFLNTASNTGFSRLKRCHIKRALKTGFLRLKRFLRLKVEAREAAFVRLKVEAREAASSRLEREAAFLRLKRCS